MVEKAVIFDALTGETRIEEREVGEVVEEVLPPQPPTLEERIKEVEEVNSFQDDLINVSLMATDEVFCMLEPLLETMSIKERGVSRMVDMYVAMIQRGLKTLEDVPARYREEVKRVLSQLEK